MNVDMDDPSRSSSSVLSLRLFQRSLSFPFRSSSNNNEGVMPSHPKGAAAGKTDDGGRDGAGIAKQYGVRAGAFLSQGSRSTQEDRFLIWQGRHPIAGPLSIFAVFDGHCGTVSVDVCRRDLVSEIVRHSSWARLATCSSSPPAVTVVENNNVPGCGEQQVKNEANDSINMEAGDQRVGSEHTGKIDMETRAIISDILRDVVASLECRCLIETRRACSYDGTTICIAIVYRGVCHIAHVGDCRALIIRVPSLSAEHIADMTFLSSQKVETGLENRMDMECDGDSQTMQQESPVIVERLTTDHKVGLSREAERITSGGGVLRRGRFIGVRKDLDITRALGDRDFKDLDDTLHRPHATLISDPDITHCILNNTGSSSTKRTTNTNSNTADTTALTVAPTTPVSHDDDDDDNNDGDDDNDNDVVVSQPNNYDNETFLVLATDGLSDIVGFDDHAIANCLLHTLREGGSLSDAARTVVNEGLCFRDRDNSTALIAHVVSDDAESNSLDFSSCQPENISDSPTKRGSAICDYWLASDMSPRRRRNLSSWIKNVVKQNR